MTKRVEEVISIINNSPSLFHFISIASDLLRKNGFVELNEEDDWSEIPNNFFVIRRDRSIIAVKKKDFSSGLIIAAHIDFPSLKIYNKGFPKVKTIDSSNYGYGQYGTWIGKELRLAGRVAIKQNGKIKKVLIESKGPVAALNQYTFQPSPYETELITNSFTPVNLNEQQCDADIISDFIIKSCNCTSDEVIDYDLFYTPANPIQHMGYDEDIIVGHRFDDLICAASGLLAFLDSEPSDGLSAFVGFDNEETGNETICGAASDFILKTLERAGAPRTLFASTTTVTADVNHAAMPTKNGYFAENHRLELGRGPGIVDLPSMRFASDKPSLALAKLAARKAGVTLQTFAFRDRQPTGSTFGAFVTSGAGVRNVDIGIPVLSMHTTAEAASMSDVASYMALLRELISGPHFFP